MDQAASSCVVTLLLFSTYVEKNSNETNICWTIFLYSDKAFSDFLLVDCLDENIIIIIMFK